MPKYQRFTYEREKSARSLTYYFTPSQLPTRNCIIRKLDTGVRTGNDGTQSYSNVECEYCNC